VPEALGEMMADPDPERARRVSEAMLAMVKFDIAALEAAGNGREP
jgi:predicted 3-demethylubiquinone-9 3-methyltransferase (glyoxalase superfamily)